MGYNTIVTFLQDNNINFTVNEIIINSFENIEINVEKAKLIIIFNQENKFDIYCTYNGENIKIYNASYQSVIQCIKDIKKELEETNGSTINCTMFNRNDMQVLNNELNKTNKTILAFLKQDLGLNIKYSYMKNGNSYYEGYKQINSNNVKFEIKGINNTIVEFKFNII